MLLDFLKDSKKDEFEPRPNVQVDELRVRFPGMAKKCDYGRSRSASIRLFCLECMGGSTKFVDECETADCPLWQFRRGSTSKFPEDEVRARAEVIPTEKWYETALEADNRGKHFQKAAEEARAAEED